MSGDVVARARDLLQGVSDGPWMAGRGRPGYTHWVDSKPDLVNTPIADHIDNLADAMFIAEARELVPELVDRLEFVEHEFEHERDRCSEHFDSWMSARAEVEKLRGALETIRELAQSGATCRTWPSYACHDILAVIERAGAAE